MSGRDTKLAVAFAKVYYSYDENQVVGLLIKFASKFSCWSDVRVHSKTFSTRNVRPDLKRDLWNSKLGQKVPKDSTRSYGQR